MRLTIWMFLLAAIAMAADSPWPLVLKAARIFDGRAAAVVSPRDITATSPVSLVMKEGVVYKRPLLN